MHPEFGVLREDTRRTIATVAAQLAHAADWASMTSRPTWQALGERSGRSRATIARVLARLRKASLLGVVVTGRSAGFAPMALDDGQAEAALYVLAVPSPLSPVRDLPRSSSVDEDETPSAPLSGELKNPIRARGAQIEPLRDRSLPAGQARPTLLKPNRQAEPWPRFATTSRKDDRRAASLALKRHAPVLRPLSDAKLASLLREFFLAGWTIHDVLHALDHQADGTPWPHSGAQGVRNPAGWLIHRMSAWRDEAGTVTRSRSQRADAERARLRALHRAEAERREQWTAQRAHDNSPVRRSALDAIRAQLDATRRRRLPS